MWIGVTSIVVGVVAFAITNDMPQRKGFEIDDKGSIKNQQVMVS
jgi:hypothetical protein